MGWRRNGTSAALLLSFVMSVGCTRSAQIAPRELTRLDAYPRSKTDPPVSVRTLEGRTVLIRPNFRFARVLPRDDTDAPEKVLRPPFRARLYGDMLVVEDQQPFSYQPYRLADLEGVNVAQRDPERAMPLLYGGLIGVAVGALIGVATSGDCMDQESGAEVSLCGPAASAFFGGVVGGGLGVLIAVPFTVADKYY